MAILDQSLLTLLILLGAAFIILILLIRKKQNAGRFLYPPGPRPYPIIGNLYDFPTVQPWVTYTQWQKEYGT